MQDSAWVGAWWVMFLVASALAALFSIPFYCVLPSPAKKPTRRPENLTADVQPSNKQDVQERAQDVRGAAWCRQDSAVVFSP